jgi:hypothetical protein
LTYDNVNLWFAKDETENIVMIYEIKEDDKNKYYCPICGTDVIPVAPNGITKKGGISKVTAHFSHKDSSKCSSESRIHWWFKNKFIDIGDKFSVKTDKLNEYICKEILVEHSYTVGEKIYKPDVTVLTECGNTIYFEMDYTNKKKIQDYIDFWLYLKNIVVEVDIKSLMNKNEKPEFNALFYNGKCFNIKKTDLYYNTIGKYKEELFQTKINENLIMSIKKLDWFWEDVIKYKNSEVDIEYMYLLMKSIEKDEHEVIKNILQKSICTKLYSEYMDYKKQIYLKEFSNLSFKIQEKYNNYIKIELNNKFENKIINVKSNLRYENEWVDIGYIYGGHILDEFLDKDFEYINRVINHHIEDCQNYEKFKSTINNSVIFKAVEKINNEVKLFHNNYSFELSKNTYIEDKENFNFCFKDYNIIFDLRFNGGYNPNQILSIDITNKDNIRYSKSFNDVYLYFTEIIYKYRNNLIILEDRLLKICNEISMFCNNKFKHIESKVLYKSENEVLIWFTENEQGRYGFNKKYIFNLTIKDNAFSDWDFIKNKKESKIYNTKEYSDSEIRKILINFIFTKLINQTFRKCIVCGQDFELEMEEIIRYNIKNKYIKKCGQCRKYLEYGGNSIIE